MLYPELFKQLESVRWDMDKDIPWAQFDASRLVQFADQILFIRVSPIARDSSTRPLEFALTSGFTTSTFASAPSTILTAW